MAAADEPALHVERRLADGRLLLATAAVVDTPGLTDEDANLAQQAINEALTTHADHAADAGALLTEVGRHLWRNTTGGDAVSMAIALVDEETGDATIALAGDAAALPRPGQPPHAAGDRPSADRLG